jgi:hypothetical protein
VAALVDLAVQTHGRADILVNDAHHGGDFTASRTPTSELAAPPPTSTSGARSR